MQLAQEWERALPPFLPSKVSGAPNESSARTRSEAAFTTFARFDFGDLLTPRDLIAELQSAA